MYIALSTNSLIRKAFMLSLLFLWSFVINTRYFWCWLNMIVPMSWNVVFLDYDINGVSCELKSPIPWCFCSTNLLIIWAWILSVWKNPKNIFDPNMTWQLHITWRKHRHRAWQISLYMFLNFGCLMYSAERNFQFFSDVIRKYQNDAEQGYSAALYFRCWVYHFHVKTISFLYQNIGILYIFVSMGYCCPWTFPFNNGFLDLF